MLSTIGHDAEAAVYELLEKVLASGNPKEAALKALRQADEPVPWRAIEVRGASLRLEGRAAELAGDVELTLSVSHKGPVAAAVVTPRRAARPTAAWSGCGSSAHVAKTSAKPCSATSRPTSADSSS